jgi:hypothetical protein
MNCDLAQEDIVLAVYGELPDDRAHRLEQHLARCERCRQEMEAVSALHTAMSVLPVVEPSPSLVARTRLRLDEALDAMPHGGVLRLVAQSLRRSLGYLGHVPVMGSALLLLAIAGGAWGGYHAGFHAAAGVFTASAASAATPYASAQPSAGSPGLTTLDSGQIAGVSNITVEPDTENVEVRYLRMVPETVFGTLDDPRIRQLLLLGARNRANPAVHEDSVNLLARECRAGHSCTGGPVRNALMVALRYDRDASVRSRALEGLEPYIAIDNRVRDAILESLLHDPDADIRSQAISLLAPVDADSSVREVLQTVAAQDQNPSIRNTSRQFLEQVSQIQ